jgi:ectoine hydroxylase-related dioxygenase (phytanoyl-CoA dioxygenase family)
VAYSIPCQFVASWIALEDVAEHGGELFYFPGSQRFEDYIYGEKYKSLSEAKRGGCDSGSLTKELVGHVTSLTDRAAALGIPKATFMARAGDALIWHSELVHGGMPVSRDMTRKSLVTHYCPRLIAPLFMESGASGYFRHASGAYFTSGAYPRMSPRS